MATPARSADPLTLAMNPLRIARVVRISITLTSDSAGVASPDAEPSIVPADGYVSTSIILTSLNGEC